MAKKKLLTWTDKKPEKDIGKLVFYKIQKDYFIRGIIVLIALFVYAGFSYMRDKEIYPFIVLLVIIVFFFYFFSKEQTKKQLDFIGKTKVTSIGLYVQDKIYTWTEIETLDFFKKYEKNNSNIYSYKVKLKHNGVRRRTFEVFFLIIDAGGFEKAVIKISPHLLIKTNYSENSRT